MTEKAVVLSSRTAKTKTGSILAGGAWAAAGLLMEVRSGGGRVEALERLRWQRESPPQMEYGYTPAE